MSDIVTTQVFSNGETGITATKLNNIIGQAAIQTSFVSGQPLASSIGTTDQFLLLTSGGTYARVPQSTLLTSVSGSLVPAGVGQAGIMNALSGNTTDYVSGANTCIDLTSAPAITLMRLRSYNALGNSTFEVDQANAGASVAVSGNIRVTDRWICRKPVSTLAVSAQQGGTGNRYTVPGSNYCITTGLLRNTLSTQQASLAAADGYQINHNIEGPVWREIVNDVFSLQVLVRANVAPLKFGLAIRDGASTRSLTKLATISTANTITLLQFPNLPTCPAGGTFTLTPGNVGAIFSVCLATGSTNMSPANDTWQTGNYWGAVGQDNFGALAVNSYLDLIFAQIEPGPNCTQLIDCPFTTNLDQCLRYLQKTQDYGSLPGATGGAAVSTLIPTGALSTVPGARFVKTMAKSPTVTCYSNSDGTVNAVRDVSSAGNRAVSSVTPASTGILQVNLTAAAVAGDMITYNYQADTGW